MLVAWSATRSRKRAMRTRRMARGIVAGSLIMKVRSSRKIWWLRSSTAPSSAPTRPHPPRERGVAGDEGIEAALHHGLGLRGHDRQVDVGLELRLLVELEH